MKICHVCNAECGDNAELCPVCGADISEISDVTDEVKTEIENPVLVAKFEDVVSAEIFKDILNDNGIMYSSNDDEEAGGMRVVFGGGFVSADIYVDNSDFEAAKQLYNEFLESEADFDGEFFIDEETDFEEI